MLSIRLHNAVCLVLAAVVLAVNAAPPVLRHAHGDGDRPHQHQRHSLPSIADRIAHEHHGGHVHGASPAWMAAEAARTHLLWFGWVFSLPLPTVPVEEGITGFDSVAVLARLVEIQVPVQSTSTWHRAHLLAVVADTQINSIAAVPPPPQPAPRPFQPFLCDSARHERTGVLLA